jgi:hypothetical protein
MKPLCLLLAAASACFGSQMKIWFADGAALEIRTESTSSRSPLSTGGYVLAAPSGEWRRVVLDRAGKILFAYEIEARRLSSGTTELHLRPINAARLRAERREQGEKTPDEIPTLTAPRDFPSLRPGDVVQLDILQNPATGEKIYDVLKASSEPPPSGGAQPKPAGDRLSLRQVRVLLNGAVIHEEKNTWFTGAAIQVWLPGKGAFYLTLKPVGGYRFQPTGLAEGDTLRFMAGGDTIELIGRSNVLPRSDRVLVWVYHDAVSASRAAQAEQARAALARARERYSDQHPDVLAIKKQIAVLDRPLFIACADEVEWLIKTNR